MALLLEYRFFNRMLTVDDLSKKSHQNKLKFRRAFQFLQLLLIQRVYHLDAIACSSIRPSRRQPHFNQDEEDKFQVFLGGSCNPTTWRHDQAIPYFQSRSLSYYNPQVADWTPDLVEIEHQAKEKAPLLFFVIDHDTRALASIVEVCYLASRGRRIIVVMAPMPDKNSTKFIQQKKSDDQNDNDDDYKNASEARRTLRRLLRVIGIPVFDNVQVALECAALVLEAKNSTCARDSFTDQSTNDECDSLSPLPSSPLDTSHIRSSSVVVIRSLSNKTSFDSADEFYREMRQTENISSSQMTFHRRSPIPESMNNHFRPCATPERIQGTCSINETEDEGYRSLSSTNQTLSGSNSSLASDLFGSTTDQTFEENLARSSVIEQSSTLTSILSTCHSYLPFVTSSTPTNVSVKSSIVSLLIYPLNFLKNIVSPYTLSSTQKTFSVENEETVYTETMTSTSSTCRPSSYLFDLYVAAGENDHHWLATYALPTLGEQQLNIAKRYSTHDIEQSDVTHEMSVRRQSKIIYYLINGNERLSHLAAELAFLIGERKHQIIVFLQSTVDEQTNAILSTCERRDIQRSRKYLEDLARKENIILTHSREESWEKVLSCLRSHKE